MGDISLLKTSQNILIVLPDQLNFDIVSSSVVLGSMLSSLGKNIQLLLNIENYKKNYSERINSGKLRLIGRVSNKDFVTKLPTDREVDDVVVEKVDGEFKITLKTKSGKLVKSDMKFSQESAQFDLIILMGFSEISSSTIFNESYKKNLFSKNLLQINYLDCALSVENSIIDPQSSMCECVKVVADQLNFRIPNTHATYLLAGVFYNTHNLRINTSKQTIKTLYDLVYKFEGSVKTANELIHQKIDFEHLVWFKEVFSQAKMIGNFCFSVINNPKIDSTLISKLTNEDKIPLSKVKGTSISLVLVVLNGKSYGFLSSEDPKNTALDLSAKYKRLGDNRFVQFWSQKSAEEIIKEISNQIAIENTVGQDGVKSSETNLTKNNSQESHVGVNIAFDPSKFTPTLGSQSTPEEAKPVASQNYAEI